MTTTTKQKKSAVRKFVKPNFVDEPLPVLYSCRVRLNDEERQTLKDAYIKAAAADTPAGMPTIGQSSVSSTTVYGSNSLDAKLGMNRLVMMDLLSSRDTINIVLILKIQKILGVEVFSAERMEKAFANYVSYLFTMHDGE